LPECKAPTRILAEEQPSELVCQFRIVVGSQNHTGFETQ
jgi:hypothetical protein